MTIKKANAIKNELGKFKMVNKKELMIDRVYQRSGLGDRKIIKMSREWSWLSCGTLAVTIRGGIHYVVDGQHRKLAADRIEEIKKLPCLLYESKGIAFEARAFYDKNTTRSGVRSCDKFRALIAAKDKDALEVNRIISSTGHVMGATPGEKTVAFATTLLKDYKRYPVLVEELWHLCVKMMNNDPKGLHNNIWSGMLCLEVELKKQRKSVFLAKEKQRLLSLGRTRLLEGISNSKRYHITGSPKIYAKGILNLLNYRRSNTIEI